MSHSGLTDELNSFAQRSHSVNKLLAICENRRDISLKMRAFWDEARSRWWWRQYAPLKRRSSPRRLHEAISRKVFIFKIAAVRTWNLTYITVFTRVCHWTWAGWIQCRREDDRLRTAFLELTIVLLLICSWNLLYFLPTVPKHFYFKISGDRWLRMQDLLNITTCLPVIRNTWWGEGISKSRNVVLSRIPHTIVSAQHNIRKWTKPLQNLCNSF
jgi:hypothetical protein